MTASAYGRLTPRMAWQLAAPHTWPAAILPVLVAAAAAAVTSFSISATMVCVLLVICVLMQSAVNTFNDYYDYVKGADSADDNVDPLVFKLFGKRRAQLFAVLCVPENLGTLQVPVAVPSARQTEMPLQKHARFL